MLSERLRQAREELEGKLLRLEEDERDQLLAVRVYPECAHMGCVGDAKRC